ncbi:cell wall-binding repeat-containing protein [Marinilactibacillus psychrotolerans]|uniref:Peptidoglycan hydrolase n=1 Tax=Marinilactibacillus psychrotolerans TaxID=191770 RepID=A0A5R9C0P6_9LACT|nr:cell wall-binding repeat-containing protein [Marinilactibacillus psychrotolerans]TLQ06261.1 LysM peptidoglycan-binding domain-containing protein [Marinilactibacillus psychrotolerans]
MNKKYKFITASILSSVSLLIQPITVSHAETFEVPTYIEPAVEETQNSDQEVSTSSVTRTHKNGIYTVQSEDTFSSIASSFNLSQYQLLVWNHYTSIPTNVQVGKQLAVTKAGVESQLTESEKSRLIDYNKPVSFTSAEEMIAKLAPDAVRIARQSGEEALWPSLMLAQAIHETGVEQSSGMSYKSRAPYHVLFGMKARGSVTSILDWTWEEVAVGDTRVVVQVLADFQSFKSYSDAMQGYANRFRYGPGWDANYYSGAWVSNSDSVWDVLNSGGLKGYATDGAYVQKLKEKITKYNLTKFDQTVTRISGATRFDTAVNVSKKGWDTSNTIVIANSHNFADALTGVPLAHQLNAPILLTRTNELNATTVNEISRLQAKNIVILGGEEAVSTNVEAQLKARNLSVKRYAGETRYETSQLIGEEVQRLTGTTSAVLTSGEYYADAMSVASFAAQKGEPIYLTRSNALPEEITNSASKVSKWTVVGGPAVIDQQVLTQLSKYSSTVSRLYGSDRYDTNQAILKHYQQTNEKLYISTGKNYVDALTGSLLAAKNGTGILLSEDRQDVVERNISFVKANHYYNFEMFGGQNILPNRVEQSFLNYTSSGYQNSN